MPRCEVCNIKFKTIFFNQKNCLGEDCKNAIVEKKKKVKNIKPKPDKIDYSLFFEEAIEEIMLKPTCENCGGQINITYLPHWNVAHILPKSKYKSVATHHQNFISLCSQKDNTGKNCHHYFDNNIKEIPNMHCYKAAKDKFEKFKDQVEERGILFTIFEEN